MADGLREGGRALPININGTDGRRRDGTHEEMEKGGLLLLLLLLL